MPGVFDILKEGAEMASFEADRLRRLTQTQSELKVWQQRSAAAAAALGWQVLALYDSGRLTQPELVAACRQQVDPVRQRMAALQARAEQIRGEKLPSGMASVQYGRFCPRCQILLPPGTGFCPNCGNQTIEKSPPQRAANGRCARCGAPLTEGVQFCTNCGAHVEVAAANRRTCSSCLSAAPAEAVFCPNCGASLSVPSQTTEEPPSASAATGEVSEHFCPTCGTSLPVEAAFCPICGISLGTLESGAEAEEEGPVDE